MTTKTKDFTKEHAIFARFQPRYEIPNFLVEGVRAKIRKETMFLEENQKPINKWILYFQIDNLRKAYPENLIKRAKEINTGSRFDLTHGLISMMVEIIRIIRSGLISEIPGLKEAVLEAFNNMPIENERFNNLDDIGPAYFGKMWNVGLGEEIFARFVANMNANYKLSEVQKNRIQQVLKNRRDFEIFHSLVFDRIRQNDGVPIVQRITPYQHSKYTQRVLQVLEPANDMVGTYDASKLVTFLYEVLDLDKLETELVGGKKTDSLNGHVGFEAIFKLYIKYLGEPEREYTY